MLRRKIEKRLLKWKDNTNKKPLLIKGCRQCGKTSSVLKFAKENYKNVVYLNFIEHPEYKTFFTDTLDVNEILKKMSTLYNIGVNENVDKTILIFDEIQYCGNARTALKFFCIDGRYDVIATGSLLGVKGVGDEVVSVPVGYEENINMYPMDFEEFLWANNIHEEVINDLKNNFDNYKKIDEATHERLQKLFLSYIIVGGMPRAVDEYIKTNKLDGVLKIQKDIISDYRDDVVKYAKGNAKVKILECFDSITSQLSKENKKFQYSIVKKGSKARDYDGCIEWLVDAGIVVKCKNLNTLELPFDGNSNSDCFKIYMQDIGLLVAMLEEGTQFDILNNKLWTYKGAIYENVAADILSKMGRKLYYYRKDSGLEIDLAIRYKNECVPIEIKSQTGKAKSLTTVLKNEDVYHINYGMKFGNYNIGKEGKLLTTPLYTLFLLNEHEE